MATILKTFRIHGEQQKVYVNFIFVEKKETASGKIDGFSESPKFSRTSGHTVNSRALYLLLHLLQMSELPRRLALDRFMLLKGFSPEDELKKFFDLLPYFL